MRICTIQLKVTKLTFQIISKVFNSIQRNINGNKDKRAATNIQKRQKTIKSVISGESKRENYFFSTKRIKHTHAQFENEILDNRCYLFCRYRCSTTGRTGRILQCRQPMPQSRLGLLSTLSLCLGPMQSQPYDSNKQ
jgi:hypothetical protein